MSIFIFAFWLLLCGRLGPDVLLTGLVLTALTTLFAYRFLGFTYKSELRLLRIAPLFVVYLVVLLRDVLLSNLAVARLVLKRDLPAAPTLYTFQTDFSGNWARAVLAISITLTPGTVTVTVTGDVFRVHGILPGAGADILGGRCMRLLRRMDAAASAREKRPNT